MAVSLLNFPSPKNGASELKQPVYMYLYVCMCVCMCIYMCVCVHLCVCVCLYVCKSACLYVYVSTSVCLLYVCLCFCLSVCRSEDRRMDGCMCVCVCVILSPTLKRTVLDLPNDPEPVRPTLLDMLDNPCLSSDRRLCRSHWRFSF